MFETVTVQVIGALLDRREFVVYAPACSSSSNYTTIIESHSSTDPLGLLERVRCPVSIIASDTIPVKVYRFVALIKLSRLPTLYFQVTRLRPPTSAYS